MHCCINVKERENVHRESDACPDGASHLKMKTPDLLLQKTPYFSFFPTPHPRHLTVRCHLTGGLSQITYIIVYSVP